jgi:hypothetical protein
LACAHRPAAADRRQHHFRQRHRVYFEDPPSTINIDNPKLTPWVSVDRVRREGAAIVCPETDTFCVRALRGYAAYYQVVVDENAVVSRRYFGFDSPPERFEILVIAPDSPQGMHSAITPER